MKTIVLIALLTLLQAAPPVPRKTTNNPNKASENQEHKTSSNKTQPNKSHPIENATKTAITQQDGAENASTNEKKSESVRIAPVEVHKDWADYLFIVASLLLTLATFIIAIYAAIQAKAAKQSADNDERSVRLTERADVLLEAAGLSYGATGQLDGHTMVKLSFKNFGRTRANNVILAANLLIPGVPNASTLPPMPQIAMGAGDSQTVAFGNFMRFLTEGTFLGISNGVTKMEFIGKVTYEDVFGDNHICECAGYFEYRTRSFVCTKNEGK